MGSMDTFESLLKDVVQAKRLSASKMGSLTEIAMKSMEQDTQLVSILYRAHKSLQAPAKVSSLYIFDALCRAARHHVVKHGLTGDINSSKGNCATFLLKVEGILEALFQDMISIGTQESKDKTKKILDIWVKGNTFPSQMLSRLMDIVEGREQVSEMKPLTTSDPRMAGQPAIPKPPAIVEGLPVPPLVMDPQVTLLALLAQAAKGTNNPNQTTPNTGPGGGLDAAQLAVLQQLALAQTANNAAPSQPTPGPQVLPSQTGSAFSGAPSFRNNASYDDHDDQRPIPPRSPERVNTYDDHVNDRPSTRGGFRGGFRGRWRGEGRRWDDRDRDRYRDRDRDDWSPVRKPRRSRSRSPPSRFGGRRDMRPYSPPRRPTAPRGRRDSPKAPRDPGKDEFGRDIRPQSPENTTPTPPKTTTPTPPPASALPSERTIETKSSPAITSNHDQMSFTPSIAANKTPDTSSAPLTVSGQAPSGGMENFNPATFDFTSPAAWEALGKMWHVTHGQLPSMEQLMQYVVAAQASLVNSEDWSNMSTDGWNGPDRNSGFSGGRGRHHDSGRTYNGPYNVSQHETDAIVLGGGDSSPHDANAEPLPESQRKGGGGGKMQKVGDNWVFVREP